MTNRDAISFMVQNVGAVVARFSTRRSRQGEVATYYRWNGSGFETRKGSEGLPLGASFVPVTSTSRLYRDEAGYQYEQVTAESVSNPLPTNTDFTYTLERGLDGDIEVSQLAAALDARYQRRA